MHIYILPDIIISNYGIPCSLFGKSILNLSTCYLFSMRVNDIYIYMPCKCHFIGWQSMNVHHHPIRSPWFFSKKIQVDPSAPGPAQPSWSPSSGAPSVPPKSQHRWEMSRPPWGRCCCWWQVEAGRRGDGDLGMLLLDHVGSLMDWCWWFNEIYLWFKCDLMGSNGDWVALNGDSLVIGGI